MLNWCFLALIYRLLGNNDFTSLPFDLFAPLDNPVVLYVKERKKKQASIQRGLLNFPAFFFPLPHSLAGLLGRLCDHCCVGVLGGSLSLAIYRISKLWGRQEKGTIGNCLAKRWDRDALGPILACKLSRQQTVKKMYGICAGGKGRWMMMRSIEAGIPLLMQKRRRKECSFQTLWFFSFRMHSVASSHSCDPCIENPRVHCWCTAVQYASPPAWSVLPCLFFFLVCIGVFTHLSLSLEKEKKRKVAKRSVDVVNTCRDLSINPFLTCAPPTNALSYFGPTFCVAPPVTCPPPPPPAECNVGDANGDGLLTINDLVAFVELIVG